MKNIEITKSGKLYDINILYYKLSEINKEIIKMLNRGRDNEYLFYNGFS